MGPARLLRQKKERLADVCNSAQRELGKDQKDQKLKRMSGEVHHVVPRGGRGTKRRVPENSKGGSSTANDPPGKKSKSELNTPDLAPNAFPKEHPFNKDGYRYILAEADPHSPFRQDFDEATEMAGKPIPGFLCRVFSPE